MYVYIYIYIYIFMVRTTIDGFFEAAIKKLESCSEWIDVRVCFYIHTASSHP